MAKIAGLNDIQRKSLKKHIDHAFDLGQSIKALTAEQAESRKEITSLMKAGGVEVAEADRGQATFVPGARKRTIDKAKLAKKLKPAEYLEVSEPVLSRVDALLSEDELADIITETLGEPYIRIDKIGAAEKGGK